MREATRNYILFIILSLLALFETASGFILWLALPRDGGSQGRGFGDEAVFWSVTRHMWVELHDWVAVALVVVVTIHLALHWKWIVYMTKSFFKKEP